MSVQLDRLLAGYYNSNPLTGSNLGGLALGGHKVNFPAALADFAVVANDVNQAMLDAAQVSADKAQVAADKAYVAANVRPAFGSESSLASAATTDLGTATTLLVLITGSTNITSFGASAALSKPMFVIKFGGALTLTHSAALLLPGSANIVTALGDTAIVQYLGSGAWRVLDYTRASGLPVVAPIDTAFGAEQAVASAATCDIGASGTRAINVTGTTAITSLGASANLNNPHYLLRFTNALTLTHSASLVLPGAANIATAAGDTAIAQYLGSGAWKIVDYTRVSGLPVTTPAATAFGAEATLASAATTDLGSQNSLYVLITGATGITSFGSSATTARPIYAVKFAAALTLTHGVALLLPGSANITTAAGDAAILQYGGSGNWRVLHYTRADGKPLASALATTAEVQAGAVTDKAVTPAGLAAQLAHVGMADFRGLDIAAPGGTQGATALAVAVLVKTAGGVARLIPNLNVSLDISTSGAVNKLDSGAAAANTWYYLFAISTGAVDGVLASLSATNPTLPSGYTFQSRIGAFITDGSGNIRGYSQKGRRARFRAALPSLASGAVGQVTAAVSWSAINWSSCAPPTASAIMILASNVAGTMIVAPRSDFGEFSSASNPPPISLTIGSNFKGVFELALETGNIWWASNNSSNAIYGYGWEDNL